MSFNKKTRAPKIVGIAKRKANLDASFKFKPIKSAAVIAVPDLDAPGNSAKNLKRLQQKELQELRVLLVLLI